MPPLHLLLPFALSTLVFAYVPGPAMLYAAGQTLVRGRRGGLLAAAGIHLGGYVHVLLAAFGLAALLRLVPAAYIGLRLAGAAYLVWLGIGMLRQAEATNAAGSGRTGRHAFLHSVAVEVLNPKAALFYVAFLPQFVDPAASLPVPAQFLILGTVVNLTFSSADLLVTFFASAVMLRLRRGAAAQRVARAIGGSVLIALGVRLAVARD